MVRLEEGCEAGWRRDSGQRGLAWRDVVVEKDTILACELLKCDRYERADAAYYEDLIVLARQRLMITVN
jgi:hypothetical protein